MRLICHFEDSPAMPAHREQWGEAHLAYLKANAGEILIGGGLREQPDGAFVGGLWVMEVESLERARELVEADPYYRPDLRRYKLLVWGKAFDEPVML
jgi:uncharacterized protein